MNTEQYIYKKEVDWSVLHLGINIPISLQDVFYKNIKLILKKGESKKIKLLLEGNEYLVTLSNMSFDEKKYPNHKEMLQIRYSPNSTIAQKLRTVFNKSYDYLQIEKGLQINKKKPLSVPEYQREYIAMYSTSFDDIFSLECLTHSEIIQARQKFRKYSEIEIEQIMNTTDNSSIIKKSGIVKIRKLDKYIGDALKVVYEFRCQICGMSVGELYNTKVINIHHIDYFSKSFNNNATNILVVCPNHHSIIHATNPIFDKDKKIYIYPNGYTEGLCLNLHL